MLGLVGFADGGYVSGAGTSRSDSIPAKLSNGEFVINAAATRKNRALLEAINSGERVSTSGSSASGSGNGYGPMALTVNLIEDKSNPGQISQTTNDDGESILQITVASIMGDTQVYQAISSKFGLQGVGS
ncbi:hypothetical protein D3C81_1536500 [compost metagenome]